MELDVDDASALKAIHTQLRNMPHGLMEDIFRAVTGQACFSGDLDPRLAHLASEFASAYANCTDDVDSSPLAELSRTMAVGPPQVHDVAVHQVDGEPMTFNVEAVLMIAQRRDLDDPKLDDLIMVIQARSANSMQWRTCADLSTAVMHLLSMLTH